MAVYRVARFLARLGSAASLGPRPWRARGRSLVLVGAGFAAAGVLAIVLPWPHALAALLAPCGGRLERLQDPVVLDREGRVLLHGLGAQGRRGDWRTLDQIPRRLVQAFIAAEDSRFRSHAGFDPLAIARALKDDCIHQRIVSGASTITQQTVRLIAPARRTWPGKALEAARAVALEKLWTKDQILEQYLNRVPMPGNRRGVAMGARYVFDRDLSDLSLGECALLASLPQAPTMLDPHRAPASSTRAARLERRRAWILDRMVLAGDITRAQRDDAVAALPRPVRERTELLAAHLVTSLAYGRGLDRLRVVLHDGLAGAAPGSISQEHARVTQDDPSAGAAPAAESRAQGVPALTPEDSHESRSMGANDGPGTGDNSRECLDGGAGSSRFRSAEPLARWPIVTTLDARMQRAVEGIIASHGARLRAQACRQAACVVLDTASQEVRCWVGSMAYGAADLGCNDGVVSRRSAGSTLKPFAYALALEQGLSLSSVLPDVRRTFATPHGDYDPRDFDRREHGPVLLRTALAASLNAAAVDLARRIGPRAIAETLAHLGLLDPSRDPRDLGVGIVIGNVEVRLIDLAAAYATLAAGGDVPAPTVLRPFDAAVTREDGHAEAGTRTRAPSSRSGPLFRPQTTYMILDALADPAARLLTMGNPLCFDFPFPVSIKTGTSTGYRDTWAVGVTPRFTVAVWTGNFDGRPTAGLSGAAGAAPIMHDVLVELERGLPPRVFPRPPGLIEREVCADSGDAPTPACPIRLTELFPSAAGAPVPCRFHRDGDRSGTVLGPTYAAWLADRTRKGIGGRYRLAGDPRTDRGLDSPAPGQPGPAQARNTLLRGESEPPQGGAPFHLADRSSAQERSATGDPAAQQGPGERGPGTREATRRTAAFAHSEGSAAKERDVHAQGETVAASTSASRSAGRGWVDSGEGTGLDIVEPHAGDRFVVPRSQGSGLTVLSVRVQALPHGPAQRVRWFLDGEEQAATPPPYRWEWTPRKGRHRILAALPDLTCATEIVVSVE